MTLIAAFASPSVGFLGISDVIVSHRSAGEAPIVDLPLRPPGFRHRAGDRVISGVAQKSVILGRTLVQWSGDLDVSRNLIRAIDRLTAHGERFIDKGDLFARCGISSGELDQVCIIYHYNPDDDHVGKWQWRCGVQKVGDTELWYQGSGVGDYFYATAIDAPDDRPPPETLLGTALARAFSHLSTEAASDQRFDAMFGGWLEFIHKTPRSFSKQPYAIKLWRVNDKRQIVGRDPFLFCWYVDHDLVICRFTWEQRDGVSKIAHKLFLVRDFLGRGPREVNADPQYDPYMIAHFVINVDTKKVRTDLTFNYDDGGFQATVHREKGFDMKMSSEFIQRLHDGGDIAYRIIIDNSTDD